jgi:hypothetical protein
MEEEAMAQVLQEGGPEPEMAQVEVEAVERDGMVNLLVV